jgi:hypothetical protein
MTKHLKQYIIQFTVLFLLLLLPLAGVICNGTFEKSYLEFPPQTHYVKHAPFSWQVFIGLALFIIIVVFPFIFRIIYCNIKGKVKISDLGARTTGYGPRLLLLSGLLVGAISWILAWNRFEWFTDLQSFTFTPLWISYIIVINALVWMRTGKCMMISRPKFFAWLFVLSAVFWWFFEYLNRFVQNWYYEGVGDLTPFLYFLYATFPFATVLPAVLGTYELLDSFPRVSAGLQDFIKITTPKPKLVAWGGLILCSVGLALIGIYPDYLFPLLWVSPLGILTAVQTLQGRKTIFANLAKGDWRQITLLALSALICGFFWEMWNWHSLAKWIYEVPFVNEYKIFEMPVLGYSGYLPFGLECAVIAEFLNINLEGKNAD